MPDNMPDDQVEWDRLLRHLPTFESPDFDTGEVAGGELEDGTLIMPWWRASEALIEFEQDVYDSGAVLWGFDWMSWSEEARQLIDDPEELRSVDLLTREVMVRQLRSDHMTTSNDR